MQMIAHHFWFRICSLVWLILNSLEHRFQFVFLSLWQMIKFTNTGKCVFSRDAFLPEFERIGGKSQTDEGHLFLVMIEQVPKLGTSFSSTEPLVGFPDEGWTQINPVSNQYLLFIRLEGFGVREPSQLTLTLSSGSQLLSGRPSCSSFDSCWGRPPENHDPRKL